MSVEHIIKPEVLEQGQLELLDELELEYSSTRNRLSYLGGYIMEITRRVSEQGVTTSREKE